ncbi:MAG TPA: alpha/beta fold hydrolase [Ktedonobacteraceae bacterium]|nr:alpha/beta fold hydrolase [Ktedonobacteraceae bacterium]
MPESIQPAQSFAQTRGAELEIRRYQAADYDDVWRLHELALQEVGAFLGHGYWDDDLHHIEEVYLQNRGEFFVGLLDGRIVAMGALRKTSLERAEIKRMRTHPSVQGRGYGQLILDELERRAAALGYTTLHLDTSVVQLVAQKFYTKNGYKETEREMRRWLECILFEKQIESTHTPPKEQPMPESTQPARGFAELNGAKLYYEIAGAGHPLVLLHEGIADSRMYDDQFYNFAQQYRVVRYDLPSFGQSDIPPVNEPISLSENLRGLLAFLGIEKTYLLGMSMGGSIALDFTLAHPDMVDALILAASGLSGHEFTSFETVYKAIGEEIEEAAKRGDYERASELETRIWVDGPERTPEQVDPLLRRRMYEMNLYNYQRLGNAEFPPPLPLDPPAIARLNEVAVPTCLIIGDKDVRELLGVMDILEQGIPGAKKVVMHGVAHALNLEQPEEFNRIVLDFLRSL